MPYNQGQYNDQRYNINGVYYASSLAETITETDGTQLADVLKALADSLTVADNTIAFFPSQLFADFVFMDEMLQIQFTNKALNDTLRLSDWLSIERLHTNNEWYD